MESLTPWKREYVLATKDLKYVATFVDIYGDGAELTLDPVEDAVPMYNDEEYDSYTLQTVTDDMKKIKDLAAHDISLSVGNTIIVDQAHKQQILQSLQPYELRQRSQFTLKPLTAKTIKRHQENDKIINMIQTQLNDPSINQSKLKKIQDALK